MNMDLYNYFWPVLTLILLLIYIWSVWPYYFFNDLGIPGPRPLPFVGNFLTLLRKGITTAEKEWNKQYGEIFRIYEGRTPAIYVWNLDLLKEIFIKDFNKFPNRREIKFVQPELESTILNLKEDRWKDVRTILTPAFSSGKLKQMTSLITCCCEELVQSFQEKAQSKEMLNASEFFGAFTLDAIASTAFGVNVSSQKDKFNPFVVHCKNSFVSRLPIGFLLSLFFPFFIPLIKFIFTIGPPRSTLQFFKNNTQKILDMRRMGKQERNDLIQLMINSHLEIENDAFLSNEKNNISGSKKKGLMDSEIIAQSITFLLAGYETTGTTLSNASYLLSLHPEWQEKIVKEITDILGDRKEMTYDDISKFHYIEMVLLETLRLYPPVTRIQRTSVQEYKLENYKLPKGSLIVIPIYCIHHDEKIWPNPEKFDPERFSSEEKTSRHAMSFLAFGNGPRNCIGLRLALLEAKMALAHILKEFIFKPCEKTEIPLKMTNTQLSRAKNGIWIRVEKRN